MLFYQKHMKHVLKI